MAVAMPGRHAPWPDLRPTWTEILTFALSIANATTEAAASKLLYGPVALNSLQMSGTANDSQNSRVFVGFANIDVPSTVGNETPGSVVTDYAGDIAGADKFFTSQDEFTAVAPLRLVYDGLTRLIFAVRNSTGATQRYECTAVITHLTLVTPVCGCRGH